MSLFVSSLNPCSQSIYSKLHHYYNRIQIKNPKIRVAYLGIFRSTANTLSDVPKSRIVRISGHFNGEAINMLPTSLEVLHMAVNDDHDARDWFEALPKLSHTHPSLECICELVSFVMLLQRKCFRQGLVNCSSFRLLHTTWYVF